MLPEVYRHRYQEFKQALERLLVVAGADSQEEPQRSPALVAVQQLFRQQILGVSVDDLDERLASRLLSFQTEMHKQLRLLEMEATFLASSRREETRSARRSQVSDRIKTLIGYCESLLGE